MEVGSFYWSIPKAGDTRYIAFKKIWNQIPKIFISQKYQEKTQSYATFQLSNITKRGFNITTAYTTGQFSPEVTYLAIA